MIVSTVVVAVACLWIGWRAAWYVAIDSCLDMGGVWENRGWYCAGALTADEMGASPRR